MCSHPHSCVCIAEHRCQSNGCGYVIVMDGNMKNHQDVCFAASAGYVEYKGLPRRVRTGCPNSLSEFKSHYCALHPPAVIPKKDSIGTSIATSSTLPAEEQVGMIIGKRETQNCILYEVCTCMKSTIHTRVNII